MIASISVGVSENNVTFDVNDLTVLSYLMDSRLFEFWIYYTLWIFGTAPFPCFGLFLKAAKIPHQGCLIMG